MIDLLKDENGGSAVEYTLLLSLIFLAVIVAVTAFGSAVNSKLFAETANLFPH